MILTALSLIKFESKVTSLSPDFILSTSSTKLSNPSPLREKVSNQI
jgi:hypothetical protein